MPERRPFRRIDKDRWIGGVCSGIAYAYVLPVTGVRIFFVLFVFILTNPYTEYVGQILFWVYILAWLFGRDWNQDPEDYTERTSYS